VALVSLEGKAASNLDISMSCVFSALSLFVRYRGVETEQLNAQAMEHIVDKNRLERLNQITKERAKKRNPKGEVERIRLGMLYMLYVVTKGTCYT
jgi:hypothetical protein